MTTTSPADTWPVAQICQTRATGRFDQLVDFYTDGLGLPVLYRFGSPGGRGAMLGMPDARCHMELIEVADTQTAPPSAHNVLVLHIPARERRDDIVARLVAGGASPVAPVNPWWIDKAIVFNDPDGWPVVLALGQGLST